MDEIIDDERENFKNKYGTSYKVLFYIYSFIAVVGFLFKTMHWPGADINILVGLAGLSGHLMIFAFFKSKNKIQKAIAVILPFIFLYLILGVFHFHPKIMEIYLTIFIFTCGLAYLLRK